MIKIGNFSKLTQVSIRSLRHYDKLGLLNPVHVDRFSGHRFYSLDQLPRLNRIIALKDMGLSLKEITDLVNTGISADDLQYMLHQKRLELCQHIDDSIRRLTHVETRLRMIEREGTIPKLEVVVKSIPTTNILSYHGVLEHGSEINQLMYDVGNTIEDHGIKWELPIGLFHPNPDDHPQESPNTYGPRPYHINKQGFEAAFSIEGNSPTSIPFRRTEQITCRQLPADTMMATIIYKGPYRLRGDASYAFYEWADENDYRLMGTIRELYLRVVDRDIEHADNLVEIQFPVRPCQSPIYQ